MHSPAQEVDDTAEQAASPGANSNSSFKAGAVASPADIFGSDSAGSGPVAAAKTRTVLRSGTGNESKLCFATINGFDNRTDINTQN